MKLRVEKKIIDNYRVRAVWYSVWKDEEKLFETLDKKEIKAFIKEKFHGNSNTNNIENLVELHESGVEEE